MDMDPQILKIIFEQNENTIRIQKNLVQKNPTKEKTRFSTVQLGSSTLILSKTNNSQCSEAKHQEFLDQYQRKITFFDDFAAKTINRSLNQLLSKHGHNFEIHDPLPTNPK